MKIKIDKTKCINCGICTVLYEELFIMDSSGNVAVVEIEEKNTDMEKVKQAIDSCSLSAISTVE